MNLMRIVKVVLLVIGAAFLGLALLLSRAARSSGPSDYNSAGSSSASAVSKFSRRKPVDVEAKLRPYLTDTVSKQHAVGNEAERKIERAISIFEESVTAALPDVEKELCGFRNSCALIADMARDKVQGGNRVEERLTAALNTITTGSVGRLNRELEEIYANELNQLDNNAREMIVAITAEYPTITGEALPLELKAELTDNLRVKATMAASKHAVMTGTLFTIEAVFLKQTVRALSRLAARLYGRTAAKAAAAAAAPAVDGPLPIGDIVAAGMATWTIVDICKLDKEMRHGTKKAFEQSLTQIVYNYRKEALACARAYKDAANSDLAAAFNTIVAQAGGK